MTRAEDQREELEAAVWRSLGKARAPLSPAWQQAHVAAVMEAADAYARASRRLGPRKPELAAREPKPRAVHYAPAGSVRKACRPGDPLSSMNWAVTDILGAVTCGLCRKTPAWLEAVR